MYRTLMICMALCIPAANVAADGTRDTGASKVPDYTQYDAEVIASVARRVHLRMIKAETALADANKRIEQLEAKLAETKKQLLARDSQMRKLRRLAENAGVAVPESLVGALAGGGPQAKGMDRDAMEAAAKKQLGGKLPDDEKSFLKALRTLPLAKQFIKTVTVDGDTVTVVLMPTWQMIPHPMRLQGAQEFQKKWAEMHCPDDPKRARIKLVDMRKSTVGGSDKNDPTKVWVSK